MRKLAPATACSKDYGQAHPLGPAPLSPSRAYALFAVAVLRRRARLVRGRAQTCKLALLHGVEEVGTGGAFERLQHRREFVRCFVASPTGVGRLAPSSGNKPVYNVG